MQASRFFLCLSLAVLLARSSFAGTLVQLHISASTNFLGDIEVELYDQDKPITVNNFLRYIETGLFKDSILHRCPTNAITGVSDFVIQGGAIYIANRGTSNAIYSSIPTFPPIPDEFAVGHTYSNVYGTLAMAKQAGNTNSASSSWFFNLNSNSSLDAADTNNLFAVFGHVVRGTNLLNFFLGRSINNGIQNLGGALATLPVNYSGSRPVTFNDLYYVDFTILSAHIGLDTNGARLVSWPSINGLTNNIEYTTNLPPVWQVLAGAVGNGNVFTLIDTNRNDSQRFYRIHVLY